MLNSSHLPLRQWEKKTKPNQTKTPRMQHISSACASIQKNKDNFKMTCSLACLGEQKMDRTNPTSGMSCATWNRLSTPWGCWRDPMQSWGSPDASEELPGFCAREAGCERQFLVSNRFTLASMSQDFPGKHFESCTPYNHISTQSFRGEKCTSNSYVVR